MMPLLRAEAVAYRYPQGQTGLSPISLTVQAGDLLLVTGPSGCGKSTLARCLTGIIPHLYRGELSGSVWLAGQRTVDVPLWDLAERAGFVFQNTAAQLLASSVEDEVVFGLENLGLPADEIRKRVDDVLGRFGLLAMRDRSPQTLSGGEQQRLALAAVMARRPPLLVLDEPLSMLDPSASYALVSHLETLARDGTGVVVCEHRREYLDPVSDLRTLLLSGNGHGADTASGTADAGLRYPHVAAFDLDVADLGVTLGGAPILHDLAFRMTGGQIVAIVGRSGVGKTTLLRALVGLQRSTGDICVSDGAPDLTMVFQNPDLQLFNATVREEILYRLDEPDMDRYQWLLRVLGLGAYEATSPLLLSEGEKKRVALATALMAAPRHGVLLDEPALGQDAAHKHRLMVIARALADAGRLVVMTTHDLSLAAEADRLLVLGQDGIVADGAPPAVLRDAQVWQRVGLRVPAWVMPAPAKLGVAS